MTRYDLAIIAHECFRQVGSIKVLFPGDECEDASIIFHRVCLHGQHIGDLSMECPPIFSLAEYQAFARKAEIDPHTLMISTENDGMDVILAW